MIANTDKHRSTILLYVILAYAITWAIWIPTLIIAAREGYALPVPPNYADLARDGYRDTRHATVAAIFSLAVYGPLVAGFVATWRDSGKAGILDLLRRISKWRIPVRWILIAVALNLVILVVPLAIGLLTGMVVLSSLEVLGLSALGIAFVRQLFTSGLGEEPGWRGYLWPRLEARHGADKAIWVLGLVWAIWHYPFTIYTTLAGMQQPAPTAAIILTVLLALAGQTMSLIGMTTLYAWLYHYTESVALAILFHALSNTLPLLVTGVTHPTINIITALIPWGIVFALEKLIGEERFPVSRAKPTVSSPE